MDPHPSKKSRTEPEEIVTLNAGAQLQAACKRRFESAIDAIEDDDCDATVIARSYEVY